MEAGELAGWRAADRGGAARRNQPTEFDSTASRAPATGAVCERECASACGVFSAGSGSPSPRVQKLANRCCLGLSLFGWGAVCECPPPDSGRARRGRPSRRSENCLGESLRKAADRKPGYGGGEARKDGRRVSRGTTKTTRQCAIVKAAHAIRILHNCREHTRISAQPPHACAAMSPTEEEAGLDGAPSADSPRPTTAAGQASSSAADTSPQQKTQQSVGMQVVVVGPWPASASTHRIASSISIEGATLDLRTAVVFGACSSSHMYSGRHIHRMRPCARSTEQQALPGSC